MRQIKHIVRRTDSSQSLVNGPVFSSRAQSLFLPHYSQGIRHELVDSSGSQWQRGDKHSRLRTANWVQHSIFFFLNYETEVQEGNVLLSRPSQWWWWGLPTPISRDLLPDPFSWQAKVSVGGQEHRQQARDWASSHEPGDSADAKWPLWPTAQSSLLLGPLEERPCSLPVHPGFCEKRQVCWHRSWWRSWCWCHQCWGCLWCRWSHCWRSCCHPSCQDKHILSIRTSRCASSCWWYRQIRTIPGGSLCHKAPDKALLPLMRYDSSSRVPFILAAMDWQLGEVADTYLPPKAGCFPEQRWLKTLPTSYPILSFISGSL